MPCYKVFGGQGILGRSSVNTSENSFTIGTFSSFFFSSYVYDTCWYCPTALLANLFSFIVETTFWVVPVLVPLNLKLGPASGENTTFFLRQSTLAWFQLAYPCLILGRNQSSLLLLGLCLEFGWLLLLNHSLLLALFNLTTSSFTNRGCHLPCLTLSHRLGETVLETKVRLLKSKAHLYAYIL